MQLGEPGRWDAPDAAVRPDLVVVLPPDGGGGPGLLQGLKPLLVQVFSHLLIHALINALRICLKSFTRKLASSSRRSA